MTLKWKIVIGVGILLLGYGAYWAYGQYSFYKEKAGVVAGQEEIQRDLEKADLQHIETEDMLRRQLALKEQAIGALERKYCDLESQIKNIVVPSDPSDLVDAFRRHGFRSARIVTKP